MFTQQSSHRASAPTRNTKKSNKLRRIAPKTNVQIITAVQQPNNKFRVEKFVYVPVNEELIAAESIAADRRVGKIPDQKFNRLEEFDDEFEEPVKVESMGMSSADQPFPDYSPFFPPEFRSNAADEKIATLILEPNSRAISGNDGVSISNPLSRAILRRDTAVKLLYRPQSVAISGANGIAHAQAELLLDFIENDDEADANEK